ncbi:non-specific lipid transfer protein GPI-anchored 5-like [Populus nigra]|uniref:non-specific lipid transfer protein GPI-anchored 5-like n=1 Tax=Populus nigra TaxID=3691 RepID=UPI002B27B600|nr:non-specific lipid transfer protein GPI-anchored 5-like [Populus nigra]
MASRGINMGLVMVLIVAMLSAKAMAQSGCTNVLISMAPCLSYVTGSSSTPSSSCCSQLASVVLSQPQCLCAALNGGGASLGLNINETLALALPAACKVQTPPVSKCNDINGPVMSPADSPDGLPGNSSSTPSCRWKFYILRKHRGGSKTVPATGGSPGNGLIINKTLQLVLFVVFMASSASTLSSY